MFEAVQFIEKLDRTQPLETTLGEFPDEDKAVGVARGARAAFLESGDQDYAWWVVRVSGAPLASFIADSKSDKEFALDLTSGELVEITG